MDAHHGPQGDPDHREHRRDRRQFADGQARIGLLEKQIDVAEPLDERLEDAGPVVQGLGENAGFFGLGVLGGGRG